MWPTSGHTLIVLDIMLPDMEGFDVAERLSAKRIDVPIIFLTARDATEDKVRGLTIGGDDYVTKPFSLEELVARLRTILRRSGLAEEDSNRLVFEDLELDEDTREVTRGGRPIELTATEYRLLRYLMLNGRAGADPGAAPRPRLGATTSAATPACWRPTSATCARSSTPTDPPLIHTVRGVGYALRAPRG